MKQVLVAVGVVYSPDKGFFICRRASHQHQGGKWEFPGGKVEKNEQVHNALERELAEEINIRVKHALPLMEIEHQYVDKAVKLGVWLVDEFDGEAKSLEGLEYQWVNCMQLADMDFPEANQPIVDYLQKHFSE